MKTKQILKLLVFSCLSFLSLEQGKSQEWMMRVHAAEKFAESPALSCFLPSFAGLHFRNDFGIKEMMFTDAEGALSLRKNKLFFSVSHYGYVNYGELGMSAGYGRQFGDRFAMTARVFYLMAHARDYPPRHSLCTDFSIACRVSPKLLFDATVYNPFMMRYGVVGQDVIPLRFSIGCTYTPVRKLVASFSMSKELPGGWEMDSRFMTQPMPPLLVAAECSNHRLGIYIGWIIRQFVVSVSAAWYYRISVSPEIGGFYFHDETIRR